MSKELTKIKGIGAGTVNKLTEAGIISLQQLANSIPAELANIKGVSLTSAQKWIDEANNLLNYGDVDSTSQLKTVKSAPKTTTKTIMKKSIQKSIVEPEIPFSDTADLIPRFLLNRISKKAQIILKMSFTSLKRENLKNLESYLKILTPERVKYNPTYPDEKNAILAIDEKSKLIDNLILHHKDMQSQEFFHKHIIIPMRRRVFKVYIDKLNENFGPEEAAIKIYDKLNKKIKKSYPFSEIEFIRKIQKIIEERYPEKAKLYYKRKK